MRRAYLYDQPASDADQMDVGDDYFIDTPSTRREALRTLIEADGLRSGDTLVVSAKSKLGKGKAAQRIADMLEAMGVTLAIVPVQSVEPKRRGKRRKLTDKERTYCRAIWQGLDDAPDAIRAISNYLGFEVDRNWCNYTLGKRGG